MKNKIVVNSERIDLKPIKMMGIITTNYNSDKINVKTDYDEAFKIFRVEVELKKKTRKKK